MAQDFGDDVGDMLLRNITRYSEKAIGLILNEYFKSAIRDWQQAKLEEEGMSKEEAAIKAEVMASREHICMPFGNSTDAAYFAQVVHENGTYAAAMTDDNGNGYVQFTKDDLQKVRECTVQFSEVMTNLKCGEISELIANGKPVTQDVFKSLKPIKNLPDLPNVDGIELNLRDVTLIPVAIRFTDTPDKVEVRTFSEQDTADLDMDSDIAEGNTDVNALQQSVIEVFKGHQDTAYVGASIAPKATVVGKCPLCGADVVQRKSKSGKAFYTCSSNKSEKQEDGTWKQVAGCGFKLLGWCGKMFTAKQAASLLEGKAVKLTGCISKTTGKTFDCKAKLKKDGTIEPMFDSKPKGKYNKARR